MLSCNGKTGETSEDIATDSNTIEFSKEQLQLSEIKWSKPERREISDIVACNGIIELPPQNNLTISPVMGGNVKEIKILPGMYIRKGDRLAILEHPDYLNLQEEYFRASSQYLFQKEEYKRQGELTLEQATSLKKMQSTEADFKAMEARVFSLKKQLQLMDIDTEKLKPENISSEVEIKSPMDGYITNIFTNRGKYIGAGEKLCEIIDKNHLHLQLNLFEGDLMHLKQGQKINFNPASIPEKEFSATVELIGQAFDENKSIPVHAHINSGDNMLKPGMFVTARIMANTRRVFVLPVASLIRKENNYYAYVYKNNKFERVKLNIGKEMDKYVEILAADSGFLDRMFVTRGAYYLESSWEKSKE